MIRIINVLFVLALLLSCTEKRKIKYVVLPARITKVESFAEMSQGQTGNRVYEKIRIDYAYSYLGFQFTDYDVIDIEYAEKRKYLSLDSNDVIKIYAQKRKPKYSSIHTVFVDE